MSLNQASRDLTNVSAGFISLFGTVAITGQSVDLVKSGFKSVSKKKRKSLLEDPFAF